MNRFFAGSGFSTLRILHNNCYEHGGYTLCGTRGQFYEETDGQKVFKWELIRLETPLKMVGEWPELCFLHYPPLYQGYRCPEIIALLEQYGMERCYYDHLHGSSHRLAVGGRQGGVVYYPVSADYAGFCPQKICEQLKEGMEILTYICQYMTDNARDGSVYRRYMAGQD